MADGLRELVKRQYASRLARAASVPSIKVNLYTGQEVEAVAAAVNSSAVQEFSESCYLDCLMVADSYLTTHLGRPSTRLATQAERAWFLTIMLSLISEVKLAMRDSFGRENNLYLIADMPDGCASDLDTALRSAVVMVEKGADAIKLEVGSDEMLRILGGMSLRGFYVVAHLGYAPQTSSNRRYGTNVDEAASLFARARAVRDSGAVAVVLERVSEFVNQMLCTHHGKGLPIYSLFSGKSPYGGQSLNVWDSVFLPPFKAKFFPPTARYDMSAYPTVYTHDIIKERFSKLLRLTLRGEFPMSPPINISPGDADQLALMDPWS